ncbi:MAG: putative membrane protein [Cocleimonas sp.]|jgi:uncharacterized membrane protein
MKQSKNDKKISENENIASSGKVNEDYNPVNTSDGDGRLIVAPCNTLEFKAPIKWLKLAWEDIKAAPRVSMAWGFIIALASLVVALLAFKLGKFALLAVLLSGFTYIAPLLGVALYSISRGLEKGKQPTFAYSVKFVKRLIPYASGFFLVQIVILLIWSRSGMIATAFFPASENEQLLFWEALKSGRLLFSGEGSAFLHFLLLGSVFGSVFSSLTFLITAVSLPMLADKEVDMITVILSSINACLRNKMTMFIWAMLICIFLAIGILTFFIGYIIIMPLLGYAAWHAYRETIDASSWPAREM